MSVERKRSRVLRRPLIFAAGNPCNSPFFLYLVFFLNGILPKGFYRWWFKTPFWWLAGLVGYGFAVYAVWVWFQKWRKRQIPEDINGQLIFWGRGMI